MIALFLRYELSFDTHHPEAERIYRVNSLLQDGAKSNHHFSTPFPLAEALRSQGTIFEKVVIAHPQSKIVVGVSDDKKFLQDHILTVSPEYLELFPQHVVEGDARKSLQTPYQAVLTESTAVKFFGTNKVIGKTFRFRNEFDITVGAVIKDPPATTHLGAELLLSFVASERYLGTGFDSWSYVSGASTFVLLKEGASLSAFQKQLNSLAEQHMNSDPNMPKHVRADFTIQPLKKIHFEEQYAGGGPWGGAINTSWLWIFATIGLAVLLLACINFVNLSTAQALTRSKEVGVRKSIGAARRQLIAQFLTESWLLAFISGILAITVVQIVLPATNTLLEKKITFNLFESTGMLGIIALGLFAVGVLAGLYPAWVTARFNPAESLKSSGTLRGQPGSVVVRSTLMVSQFAISAGLLAAVLLISDQVQFLRGRNLGFDKENIVNVPIPFGQWHKVDPLLDDVAQISDYAFATATPTAEGHWGSIMSLTNGDDPNRHNVTMLLADHNFGKMYDLQLLSGRFNIPADTNYVSRQLREDQIIMKCVVNETLVRTLGFASNDEAIGKRFWFGMNNGNGEIVGVVKDFNTTSLHQKINPVLIYSLPHVYSQVGIKIHAKSNLAETLEQIEARWKKAYPDGVFEFQFLDTQIDSFYKAEKKLHRLFQIFAGIAMLISCLGLWGLATFTAQQRTKEIGIRKVLGASVNAIVILLSRDFIIMVIIALLVASPLTYYFMNDWLSNFAYHITIGPMVFVVVAGVSLLIALGTVSVHAISAALSNPVKSLRTE